MDLAEFVGAVGVKFRPTDREIINHYLAKKAYCDFSRIIREIDLCNYDPWDLRGLSKFKDEEHWYFFCRPERKYPNSAMSKRTTKSGQWKPTGNPRPIEEKGQQIGTRKTLTFYTNDKDNGKKGRTHWVVHEYRITDEIAAKSEFSLIKLKYEAEELGTTVVDEILHPVSLPLSSHSALLDLQFQDRDRSLNLADSAPPLSDNSFVLESAFNGDDLELMGGMFNLPGYEDSGIRNFQPTVRDGLVDLADSRAPTIPGNFLIIESDYGEDLMGDILTNLENERSRDYHSEATLADEISFRRGQEDHANKRQRRQSRAIQTISETLPRSCFSAEDSNSVQIGVVEELDTGTSPASSSYASYSEKPVTPGSQGKEVVASSASSIPTLQAGSHEKEATRGPTDHFVLVLSTESTLMAFKSEHTPKRSGDCVKNELVYVESSVEQNKIRDGLQAENEHHSRSSTNGFDDSCKAIRCGPTIMDHLIRLIMGFILLRMTIILGYHCA